jgi:hypothetical protein
MVGGCYPHPGLGPGAWDGLGVPGWEEPFCCWAPLVDMGAEDEEGAPLAPLAGGAEDEGSMGDFGMWAVGEEER